MYTGQWADDTRHGRGVFSYPGGDPCFVQPEGTAIRRKHVTADGHMTEAALSSFDPEPPRPPHFAFSEYAGQARLHAAIAARGSARDSDADTPRSSMSCALASVEC